MTRPHIPLKIQRKIRQIAKNRCGYCLSPQQLVMGRLEIEHIIPISKGGSNDENNLWLACSLCNRYKGNKTRAFDIKTGQIITLFNPRTQIWWEHFCWSKDGLRIIGLTPTGRVTVDVLNLSDDPDALIVRSFWVAAGWHPPQE